MQMFQTVSLRRLAGERANEVSFGRFFRNKNVTVKGLFSGNQERISHLAQKRHILLPQDTSELTYTKHNNRTEGLGHLRYKGKGVLIHPILAVDAETEGCLGVVHEEIWTRSDERPGTKKRKKIPIEDKESYRWISTAEEAKKILPSASKITIIGDRESDIYELWDRVPDDRTHLLIRIRHDRVIGNQAVKLFEYLDALPIQGHYDLRVKRDKSQVMCDTKIDIRFSKITIKEPVGKKSATDNFIELYAIDAREKAETVPIGGEPIHWRLLTTHKIETFEEACECVRWYKQRWQIEQLFRILKLQGLRIEDSQLETIEGLIRLIAMATIVAAKTLQLTMARDGKLDLRLMEVFEKKEIRAMKALNPTLEGKTEKQKNPYDMDSLNWGTWIIARLGGWKGYASEAKPGPITFLRGLRALEQISIGFQLAEKMCA